MNSFLELEKRVSLCKTKPDILQVVQESDCREINALILSLQKKAGELRAESRELADKAWILADEVRRRAEAMERRIAATTDDDLR